MALWGKTDALASVPKWLEDDANNPNKSNDRDNAIFIDTNEAGVTANRAKGLQTPGWNLYHTYTDTNGATRHRAETLVPFKVDSATAGDAGITGNTAVEDNTAVDAPSTITITAQPESANGVVGNTAVFSVTATIDPVETITYEWQESANGTAWSALSDSNTYSGSATSELTITLDDTSLDGYQYRVVLDSENSDAVTSNTATLLVANT